MIRLLGASGHRFDTRRAPRPVFVAGKTYDQIEESPDVANPGQVEWREGRALSRLSKPIWRRASEQAAMRRHGAKDWGTLST